MIHRLRRKFILINMLLISLVLAGVFTAFCASSYRRLAGESYEAMRQAMGRPMGEGGQPRLRLEGGGPRRALPTVPVFWVQLDGAGAPQEVHSRDWEVGQDTAGEAVQQALATGKREGVLRQYGLRFLVETPPAGAAAGPRVAFADMGGERRSMAGVLLTALAAGAGALAAFFAISVFLARWALRPAERAWNQQQQFVADASHELKTPLTVILANMQILLSHPRETVEDQQNWVENTRAEAERMKKLVDDLLFLARADAARAPAEPAPFPLSDAVLGAVLPFESLAFEAGVALCCDIAPNITLTGNEGQVKQLAALLTDNAVKYAGKGGRAAVALSAQGDKAVLRVHNTGKPIPPQALPHLFERFYRADKSRARERGGYGLGLAIAHAIVQAHGGKIAVESSEGEGTTFLVTLPRGK